MPLSNSLNYFLSSLSPQNGALLAPEIKMVELPAGAILYEAEDTIGQVYFPYTGMISCIVGVTDGHFVEAGVFGRNTAVGISAPLDGGIALNEAIVQVAMSAAVIDVNILRRIAKRSETLRADCVHHEEMALDQVQQVAACNALHSIDQRLARWLLQARDLLRDDLVPLTQESLSQMLGVNRSSVTLAARRLQEAGLIEYHRGHIELLDVDALRDVSCECYDAINHLFFRLVGWSPNGH